MSRCVKCDAINAAVKAERERVLEMIRPYLAHIFRAGQSYQVRDKTTDIETIELFYQNVIQMN